MDLVEPGRADRHLPDHQRRPAVTEHLDAGADGAVVGVAGHAQKSRCPPGRTASTNPVLKGTQGWWNRTSLLTLLGQIHPAVGACLPWYTTTTRDAPKDHGSSSVPATTGVAEREDWDDHHYWPFGTGLGEGTPTADLGERGLHRRRREDPAGQR